MDSLPRGGTGENVENHVRENIGWILIKTRNFYIFFYIYTIASSKCKFGNYLKCMVGFKLWYLSLFRYKVA